jgi:hypothetical protein
MQFDDPIRRIGFIQAVRNVAVDESSVTLKPVFGSDEYKFENMETGECRTMTGYGLKGGFTVSIPKRSGVIWFYKY